jgi:methylthioribose-1-phosphate isomerase
MVEKSKIPKVRAFVWKKGQLLLLDQKQLPHAIRWQRCRTWKQTAAAIQNMVVRGAPAIGCVAAYGLVLAARSEKFSTLDAQRRALKQASAGLLKARPTAVNLHWGLERMRPLWESPTASLSTLAARLEREAQAIETEDRQANIRMGEFGAALVSPGSTWMTHCNTGSLATAGLGTAFGVLWTAFQAGKIKKVLATETRPYWQGARLTAWELKNEKIPFELITDSMAAHVMKTEPVHGVIVGADRIAANGDTANKIGTYSLAVLAAHHHVPFYVAAPFSTIDLKTASGERIPIEERDASEVTSFHGQPIAPKGTRARHPAFDVTPAVLISGIITERGVARRPFVTSLHELSHQASSSPGDSFPLGRMKALEPLAL